jgi:hypothetical protein
MLTLPFQQNPGRFDRKNLEAVVAYVRTSGIKPGQQSEFLISNLTDPRSIRPIKPHQGFTPGEDAGHAWADVAEDGKLKVVIETRDLGHAGMYGFAFSDSALSPKSTGGDNDWFTLDVPGRLNYVQRHMKIDDHWWEVINNLD